MLVSAVQQSVNQLCSVSRVQLFVTLWAVIHPSPLSMGFFRSGLPFPPPGDLPDPGIKAVSAVSSALQVDSLPAEPCVDIYPSLLSLPSTPLFRSSPGSELSALCLQRLPTSSLFCTWRCVYIRAALSVCPTIVSANPFSMSAPLCLPCKLRALFPYSHILRCWGLGLQHMNFGGKKMNFGGNNSVHNT